MFGICPCYQVGGVYYLPLMCWEPQTRLQVLALVTKLQFQRFFLPEKNNTPWYMPFPLNIAASRSVCSVSVPVLSPLGVSSGVLMTPLIAAWATAFCFFSSSMVFLNSFSSESCTETMTRGSNQQINCSSCKRVLWLAPSVINQEELCSPSALPSRWDSSV